MSCLKSGLKYLILVALLIITLGICPVSATDGQATTPIRILEFNVTDTDGDGFIEGYENITVSWNVSVVDKNVSLINITIYAYYYNEMGEKVVEARLSETNPTGSSLICPPLNDYGGYLNIILRVYYKYNNNITYIESTKKFYVYNDYIAYAVRDQPKVIKGVNLTKVAILDVMDRDIVNVKFYNGYDFKLPIQNVYRVILPGEKAGYKVYVDENANKTITNFYQSFVVYNNSTPLDFYIKAPAKKALLLLIELNDTNAQKLIVDAFAKRTIPDIKLDEALNYSENVYIFTKTGYIKINPSSIININLEKINLDTISDLMERKLIEIEVADDEFWEIIGYLTLIKDAFKNNNESAMKELIDVFSRDLRDGIRLKYKLNYVPTLTAGTYVLLAISIDGDVTAVDAVMPLIVLNGTEKSNRPTIIPENNTIKIEFDENVNRIVAFVVKDVKYDANITVDLSQPIKEIARINITYPGKDLRSITYEGYDTRIKVPVGMIKGGYSSGNTLTINVKDLDLGTYKVYVVALDKGGKIYYAGAIDIGQPIVDIRPPEIVEFVVPKVVKLTWNVTTKTYDPKDITISLVVRDDYRIKNVSVIILKDGIEIFNKTTNINKSEFECRFSYTVKEPGTYTLKLIVSDYFGRSKISIITFNVVGECKMIKIKVPKNEIKVQPVAPNVNVTIIAKEKITISVACVKTTNHTAVNVTITELPIPAIKEVKEDITKVIEVARKLVKEFINITFTGDLKDLENVSVVSVDVNYANISDEPPLVFMYNKSDQRWINVTVHVEADKANKTIKINLTAIAYGLNKPLSDLLLDPVFALVSGPDLTVDVDAPSKVKVGEECSIKVTVKNDGNEKAENVEVALYLDGKCIASKSIGPLEAGESKRETFKWTPESPGTYTLTVKVDPKDEITELDETNNAKSVEINVIKVKKVVKPIGPIGGGYVVAPTPTPVPPTPTPVPTPTPKPTPTVTPTPVVTPKPTPTPTPTPIQTPTPKPWWKIPGFELIYAIIAIIAVAYILRKR